MKISTYQEARSYLESFIRPTLFRKITVDSNGQQDPLDRFRTLLNLIDNPQKKFKAVHVSGTSGKGSTSYLISRILSVSGYKTGLTISPHLEKINERMQVNNVYISDDELIGYLNTLIPHIKTMKAMPIGEPSYYEILLAITFLYFAGQHVDIAVVEVGIEGKYDATLLIDPILTILTNISLDHTAILGDTEEEIVGEAVAIIKENIPLITGIQQKSIQEIVEQRALRQGSRVIFVTSDQSVLADYSSAEGTDFSYSSPRGKIDGIHLSLIGRYQIENAAIAIEAAFHLRTMGYSLSDEQLKTALGLSSFPGRFEIIKGEPEVVLDGAHNTAKMTAFLASLEAIYPQKKKIFVIAFKKDKNISELVQLISKVASRIVVTEFHGVTDMSVRAATPAEQIANTLERLPGVQGKIYVLSDSSEAVVAAKRLAAEKNGIVIVTGSLYLVGEVRTMLV